MENNKAFVATLKNIQFIEGADNIVQADITLNNVKITQVAVSKDTKKDTLVIYFDSNLCLSETMIKDYPTLSTYLSNGNRVRIIKLRGIISNGLTIEIEKFYKYFKNENEAIKTLKEGYSFNEINGTEICHKYFPPLQNKAEHNVKNKKPKTKIIPGQFHFHVDTSQLLRNIHMLEPNQIVSISRKVHGTSAIISNCKVMRKLSFLEKLLKNFVKIDNIEYKYIIASRTTIKTVKNNVWYSAYERFFQFKLTEGETVYFEIVGYDPNSGKPIQKSGKLVWNYGCKVNDFKIAVYRITKTGPDSDIVEYSWLMMKERCAQLGVPMVEELFFGKIDQLVPFTQENVDEWKKKVVEYLKETCLNRKAEDCIGKDIHDEGVVVRIESKDIKVFKLKDEIFMLQCRGKEGEVIDLEDESTGE